MNEIKHIHLGRQSFTIAVDAHQELRHYLDAIKEQVGKKAGDVVEEVELRMAELLSERGIDSEKVIVKKDIKFLKEQLGAPHDFKDEEDGHDQASQSSSAEEEAPRRLFRDTDNAMFAGVASGLAAYFNLDAVIMRLIFVVLTFFGGTGILLYIILWLIVPEAKTSSDRLQMRGKAVTVDSLKEVVDRADLPAAAKRAGKAGTSVGRALGHAIENVAKVILGVVGIGLVAAACGMFLGATSLGVYLFIHGGQMANEIVFPTGSEAVIGLLCAVLVVYLLAFLITVVGLTMIKRRSVVKGWIVAIVAGLFFITGGVGTAIGFDIAPSIHDKYQALRQDKIYSVAAFDSVNMTGKSMRYSFVPDTKYAVEVQYFGKSLSVQKDKMRVEDGVLTLDADGFKPSGNHCNALCFYSDDRIIVTIHAPKLTAATLHGVNSEFGMSPGLSHIPSFNLHIDASSRAFIGNFEAQDVTIDVSNQNTYTATFTDLSTQNGYNDWLNVFNGIVESHIDQKVAIETKGQVCDANGARVYLNDSPQTIMLNNIAITSQEALSQKWSQNSSNIYNCLVLHNN